jgi:hypothetical protein
MALADRPKSDATVTRVDAASIVETVPATSLTPFAPLSSNRTVVEGARPASDKPRCVGDALADLDGNCVSIKLRKPWRPIAQQSLRLLWPRCISSH